MYIEEAMLQDEELIEKYFNEALSETEKKLLLERLKNDADFKAEFFRIKDLWDSARLFNGENNCDVEESWKSFKERIDFNDELNRKRRFFISLIKYAAIIIISIGIGWLSYLFLPVKKNIPISNGFTQFVVPQGQSSEIQLSDGSKVWINSGSTIKLPNDFSSENRNLQLEGEAYFRIHKDREHPFNVDASKQRITVLGTEFNVRAYKEEKTIQTTLINGKVELNIGANKFIMKPGQQVEYNEEEKTVNIINVNTDLYAAWKDGVLRFSNESFDNLILVVEHWYGVHIVYDHNKFKEMHFSGVIRKSKPIGHFFRMINETTSIQWKVNQNNEIIILSQTNRKAHSL
ncbi:MAG: FecR domain-containing protein [Bacteroidota bacterium]|nr:FecR domain-containing protein [Bacteroidota bacterium]MDP4205859.1 FecR domain-containing protein [Bacteroidota bacterium]